MSAFTPLITSLSLCYISPFSSDKMLKSLKLSDLRLVSPWNSPAGNSCLQIKCRRISPEIRMLFPYLKAMAMFCVFVNPLSHTYKYCMFIFVPHVLTNKFCLGSSLISASYSTSFSYFVLELPQLSSPSISPYFVTPTLSQVFKIILLHLTSHLDCYTSPSHSHTCNLSCFSWFSFLFSSKHISNSLGSLPPTPYSHYRLLCSLQTS